MQQQYATAARMYGPASTSSAPPPFNGYMQQPPHAGAAHPPPPMSARQSTHASAAARFHQERRQAPIYVFTTHVANRAEECVRNSQCESIIDFHRQHCRTLAQQNGAMSEVSNADPGGDVKPARTTSRKRPPSEVARSPHTPASVKAGPTTPTAVEIQQAGSKCSHSLPTTPATALAPTAPMATSGSAMHVAQRTSPIAATASNFPLFADERIAQQHHQQQFANNPLLQMERMTQEAMMQQEPQPKMSRLSSSIGSPRDAQYMMTQSPRGANTVYNVNTVPPTTEQPMNAPQQQKISEQSREQKLANLHKLGSMIGLKNEPLMNEQPLQQPPPQQQMQMMQYGAGLPPPQHQQPPPFAMPNMIRTPQGQYMPLRPGMIFVGPSGQPLLMTLRGPVPNTPEEQARLNWEMQRFHEHEMQQKHPRMPAAQRSQRIPASVKPTMSVPPNARQQRMQQQPPIPPENGYRAGGGVEFSGSPHYAPHFAPDADAYAKEYMQRSAPRHEQHYAPPPNPAQPPQHATVNNTYVNANLSIQQLNIQNVGAPITSATLMAQSIQQQQQQQQQHGRGPIPMRPPPPHPAQHPPMHPPPAYAQEYTDLPPQASNGPQYCEPLTNLDSKVPSQKLQYFPMGQQEQQQHQQHYHHQQQATMAFNAQQHYAQQQQMSMTNISHTVQTSRTEFDFNFNAADSDDLAATLGNGGGGGADDSNNSEFNW